jgi:hypothetical protein
MIKPIKNTLKFFYITKKIDKNFIIKISDNTIKLGKYSKHHFWFIFVGVLNNSSNKFSTGIILGDREEDVFEKIIYLNKYQINKWNKRFINE